jgi:hypothetical protein
MMCLLTLKLKLISILPVRFIDLNQPRAAITSVALLMAAANRNLSSRAKLLLICINSGGTESGIWFLDRVGARW